MWGPSYDLAMRPLERFGLRALRAKLLARTRGRTLEIGAGTGANFPHYPPGTVVVGIEPEPSMRRRALKKVAPPTRVEEGDAERLAFADDEFDTVVATLVLCSVRRPHAVLKEVRRVLKPSGRLLLLEHVRPPQAALGRLADALTPVWRLVSGGCHLNRDHAASIKSLGFRTVESEVLWKGVGRIWVLEKQRPSSKACRAIEGSGRQSRVRLD